MERWRSRGSPTGPSRQGGVVARCSRWPHCPATFEAVLAAVPTYRPDPIGVAPPPEFLARRLRAQALEAAWLLDLAGPGAAVLHGRLHRVPPPTAGICSPPAQPGQVLERHPPFPQGLSAVFGLSPGGSGPPTLGASVSAALVAADKGARATPRPGPVPGGSHHPSGVRPRPPGRFARPAHAA